LGAFGRISRCGQRAENFPETVPVVTPYAALAARIDAVVMGASAGGIQALSALLPALPASLRAPVFIVLHIPRDRPSLLSDIFSRKCAVPVREAEDKEPVVPGTVYFAPANYHLLLDQGPQLALSADDVYADRLLGVILTGANEDGASGLASVHDHGGITVVENPETSFSPQMALAALKMRPADLVLPLQQIGLLLGTLGAQRTENS